MAVNFTVDKPSYVIHRHEITSDIKEDEEVGAVVAKYVGAYGLNNIFVFVNNYIRKVHKCILILCPYASKRFD